MRFIVALFLIASSSISLPCEAGVSLGEAPGHILVTGEIRAGDAAVLEKLLADQTFLEEAGSFADVRLNSPGGDVQEALRMGRILRAHKVFARVDAGSVCASACVFVLAGAPSRVAIGAVVIHRPFPVSNAEIPHEERANIYKARTAAIRAYLSEMNIPEDLLNAMETIPPEAGHVLSDDELRKWRLWGKDPVHAEEEDASEARDIGISMTEYVSRKAKSAAMCDPLFRGVSAEKDPSLQKKHTLAYSDCVNAVMYNVSVQEYVRRQARAKEICTTLATQDTEWRQCLRETMRGER